MRAGGNNGFKRCIKTDVNKGFGRRFYFITVRDNEGHARKFVYNIFRSIVKKYNAKYYGKLAEKPFPHVHAIIATNEYIDFKDVWNKFIPKGVHFDGHIIEKEDDFKRIKRYIDLHDGFLSYLVILTLSPNLKLHARPIYWVKI